MQALEEALSSDRPEENELLSLVHSRLLCTGRELKALKPGEMKYPYRCAIFFGSFIASFAAVSRVFLCVLYLG